MIERHGFGRWDAASIKGVSGMKARDPIKRHRMKTGGMHVEFPRKLQQGLYCAGALFLQGQLNTRGGGFEMKGPKIGMSR